MPWTGDPGRIQSVGLQRVVHHYGVNTFTVLDAIEKTEGSLLTVLSYLGDHRKEGLNSFIAVPRSWANEVLRNYISAQYNE